MIRYLAADFIFTDKCALERNLCLVVDESLNILDLIHCSEVCASKIEKFSGILSPGFFNSHLHLELADKVFNNVQNLTDFIVKMYNSNKNTSISCIEQLDKKLYNEGVVFCADIANKDVSFFAKEKSKIKYHTFLEIFSVDPNLAEEIFLNANLKIQKLGENFNETSLTLHSLYSSSIELLNLYKSYIADKQCNISLHLMENLNENYPFVFQAEIVKALKNNNIGKSKKICSDIYFLDLLLHIFKSHHKLLFVHGIYLNLKDAKTLLNYFKNSYICVCPTSNLFIEKKIISREITNLYKERILVGTDSNASNKNMSLIEELYLFQEHSDFSLTELLKTVTINPAKYFNQDSSLGSFAKGKTPGIVNIINVNLDTLKLTNVSESLRVN